MSNVEWFLCNWNADLDELIHESELSAGLAADGTVYAPAALAGDEKAGVLAAVLSGVAPLKNCGTWYLPVLWMAGTWPHLRVVGRTISDRVRREFGGLISQRRGHAAYRGAKSP